MIDISLIQSLLPPVDEQIAKLKYAVTQYPDYTFNFTTDKTNLLKSLELGMARELSQVDSYNYSLDPLTYMNMKISEMLDGLVLGIVNQCKEHNKKEVTIFLPKTTLKEQYFYVYMREETIRLDSYVRIYFNN